MKLDLYYQGCGFSLEIRLTYNGSEGVGIHGDVHSQVCYTVFSNVFQINCHFHTYA